MNKKTLKSTPAEKMQVLYLAKHQPLIRLFLRFNGRIDNNILSKSINKSLKFAPLAGCSFSFAKHCWVENGFSSTEILRTIVTAKADETSLSNYLLSGINFAKEPQIIVYHFKGSESDSLCFLASHLAFDGMSVKNYAALISELYNAILEGKEDQVIANICYSLDRSLRPVFKTLSFKEKLALYLPANISDYPHIHLAFADTDCKAAFFIISKIDKNDFILAKEKAQKLGATVNDLVMSAYAMVLFRFSGQRDIAFPCPVSLLSCLPQNPRPAFSNLTGVYRCHVKVDLSVSFTKILSEISSSMRIQKQSVESLRGPFILNTAFSCLPWPIANRIIKKVAPPPIISFTNIGIIDSKKMQFGKERPAYGFFLTAVKTAPSCQLSVSTFEDEMYLTSAFQGSEDDKKLIADILNEIGKTIIDFSKP